jgi:hypothetical protein
LKFPALLGRIAFMDDEHNDTLEEKLDRLTELVEEDHKLIRGMYTRARWASFFRIVYWVVIVLAAFGTYVWLEPYVNRLKDAYDSVSKGGFIEQFFKTSTSNHK